MEYEDPVFQIEQRVEIIGREPVPLEDRQIAGNAAIDAAPRRRGLRYR
jgi:hypothetical protein